MMHEFPYAKPLKNHTVRGREREKERERGRERREGERVTNHLNNQTQPNYPPSETRYATLDEQLATRHLETRYPTLSYEEK